MDLWVVKMFCLVGGDCMNFRSQERIKRKNDGTLRAVLGRNSVYFFKKYRYRISNFLINRIGPLNKSFRIGKIFTNQFYSFRKFVLMAQSFKYC